MLKIAGVRLHPGMRVLLGMGLIALGLLKHNATPLIVIGAIVGLLGIVSMVSSAARASDDGDSRGAP